jgi:integrase
MELRAVATGQAAAQVKLFTPTSVQTITADRTLSEFYRLYYLPVVLKARGAGERNIDQYEQSITTWINLTGDPPLSQIDEITCANFLEQLHRKPGKRLGTRIATNTVHKHCRTLQAVIDKTGPKTRENRLGKGVLKTEAVPYLEKPSIEKQLQFDRHLRLEEIDAWLQATEDAVQPDNNMSAPIWWQSLIMFGYNTGPRIGTLLALRWSWLDKSCTWLRVPAEAAPKIHNELMIYCNAHARAALARIRRYATDPDGKIFPFPYGESWLHVLRRRQFKAAGIDRYDDGFHALRRSCSNEAMLIHPLLEPVVLGHSHKDVAGMHYRQLVDLCTKLEAMPQPKWVPRELRRQQELF